jgi:hypothetical protein
VIKLAKTATPAAKAVLRQATELRPRRKKASDGLLPSAAHQVQNPNSDHNSGFAVDITHDPKHGIDCRIVFNQLRYDKRVKYLIFQGKIWTPERGVYEYTGSNKHTKHCHISIHDKFGNDTSPWFPWLINKPSITGKIVSALTPLPKKRI